jgi:alpha-aminoadipate carrier protein LysW
MVECPECAGNVELPEGTEVGEVITCPDCSANLEVTSTNPPAVQRAPEVEEDWGE